ncbi:MAG TPA: hypothetical protein VFT26_13590 [Pyrinomonadaceae bacterium]|nr:hypothetical protein [Pyrinomonadaceae bacterium]
MHHRLGDLATKRHKKHKRTARKIICDFCAFLRPKILDTFALAGFALEQRNEAREIFGRCVEAVKTNAQKHEMIEAAAQTTRALCALLSN